MCMKIEDYLNNYFAIRYEDFVAELKHILEKVCEYVDTHGQSPCTFQNNSSFS